MANNSVTLLVEMLWPEIARFAPFNFHIEMHPVFAADGVRHEIELSSRLFGGLKATTNLDGLDVLAHNAKRIDHEILDRISKALTQIEGEAELIALVDYKWPKAA